TRRRVNAHCRSAGDRRGRKPGRRYAGNGQEDERARRRCGRRARRRNEIRHSRCRIRRRWCNRDQRGRQACRRGAQGAPARRLGAIVTATDVRPAAKEQVESLGAKFIAIEDEEFKQAETAGGYAKEMSKEYQAKQAALVSEHIKKQDIVITTALIPGRPAPRLISSDMVACMRPGAVVVDLAV